MLAMSGYLPAQWLAGELSIIAIPLFLSPGTGSSECDHNNVLMKNRSLTYIRTVNEALSSASGPDEIRPLPPYHPGGLCDPVLYQAMARAENLFFHHA